ncbi:hypothetical protein F4821DRAFT_255429 [Hypoxylon rubiginosum]|uniref:Uncharacterized protein n=1 Tax=Hypoxylon rubiginosum TaxID=110542 RepID=A0ACC0DEJ1_9PEZI|nr:hypothetical protein F4821DRAFT_255429 [Hypoxylon rubiginosum]
MAPLGTLPKIVKKSPYTGAINGEPTVAQSVKRIVLKKAVQTPTASERESVPRTSEPTLANQVEAELDAAPLSPLSQPLLPLPAMDDGEDDDYVPKKTKTRLSSHNQDSSNDHGNRLTPSANTRRHSTRRQSARATPATSEPVEPVEPAPIDSTLIDSSPAPTASSPPFQPPPSILNREPNRELADKIVEAAVDEALSHYRYPTAFALRIVYDDHAKDPHFVSMIEDVFYQRADNDTMKKFDKLMRKKKKEAKKDNKGWKYFVPPSDEHHPTPEKPKPAPYGDLIRMDLSVLDDVHDSHDDHDGDDGAIEEHVSKKVKLDEGHLTVNGNSPAKANGVGRKGLTGQKSPHKSPHKSPRGRKNRSGSVSSLSSLSSVPDDVPDDYEEYMDQVDDDLGVARPIAAEPNNAQIPAGSAQPISGQEKKPAAKKKNASPKISSSRNTPHHHPSSRDSSMPAAVVANGTSSRHNQQKSQSASSFKFPSKYADLDNSDQLVKQKHSNKSEVNGVTEDVTQQSFVRRPLQPDDLHDLPVSFELAVPPPPAAEQNRSSRTPALSSRAARAAKRRHDDLDSSLSPTALSFKADFETYSTRNSRAATPSNLRSSKKPRGGLRVKTSPMKKKATSAGIPRSSGDRPSPLGNGGPPHQDENDDTCCTCNGDGDLVCCDGCHNSCHYLCSDPPIYSEGPDRTMPDEWYCNECIYRDSPPFEEHHGVFRSLLNGLHRKLPKSFSLPDDVKEYFEGMRAGSQGDYEEPAPPKPKTSKKATEEPFDFYRLRNADGSAVLCHQCQKGAIDNRPIVPCSVCGLNWHLECLDPPLAVPPVPRTFRCPLHVEDMLAERPESLAPAHRYRMIRNAPVIEQGYSRGMANNGYVEIDWDDSEDEADAWRHHKGFGRRHRLSAHGIKLDFLDRIRQNRQNLEDRTQRSLPVGTVNPASVVPPRPISLEEQQAALNLAQLSQGSDDGLSQLYQAIISQASPAVISMMANGDSQRIASGDLGSAETTSLQAMLAQAEALTQGIRQALAGRSSSSSQNMTDATASHEVKQEPLPVNNAVDDKSIVMKDTVADSEVGDGTTDDSAMQID